MAEGWHRIGRRNPPVLESHRRAASNEVIEERYPEEIAKRQAARCLRCNVNTVFDTYNCIACNGCVDVCPESLIKLVGLSRLPDADAYPRLIAAGVEIGEAEYRGMSVAEKDAFGGVMLKDESTCIRCALCASRCPTHAITMRKFDHYQECVSIPAPNPKILYQVAIHDRV
jgi:formate hydrogenlyase subunit 6/NADH:ubiquinone oxidoreductase subunit I